MKHKLFRRTWKVDGARSHNVHLRRPRSPSLEHRARTRRHNSNNNHLPNVCTTTYRACQAIGGLSFREGKLLFLWVCIRIVSCVEISPVCFCKNIQCVKTILCRLLGYSNLNVLFILLKVTFTHLLVYTGRCCAPPPCDLFCFICGFLEESWL